LDQSVFKYKLHHKKARIQNHKNSKKIKKLGKKETKTICLQNQNKSQNFYIKDQSEKWPKVFSMCCLNANKENEILTLGCAAGTLNASYNFKEIEPLDAENCPELNQISPNTISLSTAENHDDPSLNEKDLPLSEPCHHKAKYLTFYCLCYMAFL